MTPSSANWQWQEEDDVGSANEIRPTILPSLLMDKRPSRRLGINLPCGARSSMWQEDLIKTRSMSDIAVGGPHGLEAVSPPSQPDTVNMIDVLERELSPPPPPTGQGVARPATYDDVARR